MATIDGVSFDKASYAQGETVTLTVTYTPDTASTSTHSFTATVNVVNAGGTPVATTTAPFTVTVPVSGGDKVSATDDGNRTWAETSDSGTVAVFTAVA